MTPSEYARDQEIAMVLRLWDLGLSLDTIATAANLTLHRAAGLVHTQLCAITTPSTAARDERLRLWWAALKVEARNVATGHRTAADVADDHNVPVSLVRAIADTARARINRSRHRSADRRGPGLRDAVKGKLITAFEFGYDAPDAARLADTRISTARRYLARYVAMTPEEKRAECVRVNSYRWTLAAGVWCDRAEEGTDA